MILNAVFLWVHFKKAATTQILFYYLVFFTQIVKVIG